MSDPLIQVTGLTMGWDDVVLQKDATFHVDRGEVFAILGGSGCGKSTLKSGASGGGSWCQVWAQRAQRTVRPIAPSAFGSTR
jgi:ABC-type phosphonate transport system ATPase subunit